MNGPPCVCGVPSGPLQARCPAEVTFSTSPLDVSPPQLFMHWLPEISGKKGEERAEDESDGGCFQVRTTEAEGTRHFLFSSKSRARRGRGLGSLKGKEHQLDPSKCGHRFPLRRRRKQPFCSSSEKYPLREHEQGAK